MKRKFYWCAAIITLFTLQLHSQIGSRITSFNPAVHGFKYVNSFQTEIINDVRFGGLCGGMTYTALDYFRAGKQIPQQNYRPANGTPLFNYVYDRQRSSIIDNIDKWTELFVNPFGSRTDEFFNWGLQGSGGGRLQELKTEIDKGFPIPLGLFKPGNGGTGPHHQVLAIGYDGGRYRGDLGNFKEDLKIFICDPNYPGQTKILKADPVNHIYYYEGAHDNTHDQWQTYFVDKKYSFKNPSVLDHTPGPSDGLIHQLLVEIRTGNDDLRGGNDNVNLTLNFKTKPSQTFNNINHGARWINNYAETIPINLTTGVTQDELKSMTFTTTFGGGIGGDNWNMDMVRVMIGDKEIFSKSGTPIFRFTGDAKTITIPFTIVVADNRIRELNFEIGTGGDDLRGGNDNVNITINFRDGHSQVVNNANHGDRWPNNTAKFLTIPLTTPVLLDQIKSVVLKTTFGGGMGGDNWNMDYIIIRAKGGGINQQIHGASGTPLRRFDGNNTPYIANF